MAHLQDTSFAWVPIWSESPRPKRLEDLWCTSIETLLDELDWSRYHHLLDYECGEGYDTFKIASRMNPKARLVACDSNPYRPSSGAKLKGVHHCLGDESLEPLPSGPYDFIFWRFDPTRPLLLSDKDCSRGSNLLGLGGILDTPGSQASPLLLSDCPSTTLKRLRHLCHSKSTLFLWIQSWRPMSILPCSGSLKERLNNLMAQQQDMVPFTRQNWMAELGKAGFFVRSVRPLQMADQPGSSLYQLLQSSLLQQVRHLLPEDQANQIQQDLDYLKLDPSVAIFSPQSLILVASTEPN